MANTILTDAALEINGITITLKANTIELMEGGGEVAVEAATRGGVSVPIFSPDISTQIGMFKFSVPSTIENITLFKDFKAGIGTLNSRLSGQDPDGSILTRSQQLGAIVNDPPIAVQNEGSFEVEIKGGQLV